MTFWLLIAATLIIQEFASTAVVLALAMQNHLPLWPIHLIWLGTTILDAYLGFALGALLKERLRGKRLFTWIERHWRTWKKLTGRYGGELSLSLLAIPDYPYLNGFIASWLGFPVNLAVLLTVAGNAVWYILLWGTLVGISRLFENPTTIILIIVLIGILSHFFFRFAKRRTRRDA